MQNEIGQTYCRYDRDDRQEIARSSLLGCCQTAWGALFLKMLVIRINMELHCDLLHVMAEPVSKLETSGTDVVLPSLSATRPIQSIMVRRLSRLASKAHVFTHPQQKCFRRNGTERTWSVRLVPVQPKCPS